MMDDVQKPNAYYLQKMAISSMSAFVELTGGQPLDRWKMNLQIPKNERIPFGKLLKLGPREWYVASTISVIQRCFFYIPIIYLSQDVWNNHLKYSNVISNRNIISNSYTENIMKTAWTTSCIIPCVSIFESLKADQQINNYREQTMRKIISQKWQISKASIIPSPFSTFGREFCFCYGICVLTPQIKNILNNTFGDNTVSDNTVYNDTNKKTSFYSGLSGGIAGFISQTLSQPFDVIKTNQERTHKSFGSTLLYIIRSEGITGLWKGGIPRCVRGIWTLSCLAFCQDFFSKKIETSSYNY